MGRHHLGELEQLVMLAVGRLGDRAYGAAIQRTLEEEANRDLQIATIYVTLVRLERKGYLRSRREGPTSVRGGKSRRSFRLTRKGVVALEESRAVLERMWRGYGRLSESEIP